MGEATKAYLEVSIGPRVSRGWWLTFAALWAGSFLLCFNRAARFARLVAAKCTVCGSTILRASFNRAARFARLVACKRGSMPYGQSAKRVSIGPRVSRGWHNLIGSNRRVDFGFNRAARFARLVAMVNVKDQGLPMAPVSIGPRVSRGWWRYGSSVSLTLPQVSIGPRVSRGWWRSAAPGDSPTRSGGQTFQ